MLHASQLQAVYANIFPPGKAADNDTFRFIDMRAYIRIISKEPNSSLINSVFDTDFCRCPVLLLLLPKSLVILITYKDSSSGEETGRPHLLSVQS